MTMVLMELLAFDGQESEMLDLLPCKGQSYTGRAVLHPAQLSNIPLDLHVHITTVSKGWDSTLIYIKTQDFSCTL